MGKKIIQILLSVAIMMQVVLMPLVVNANEAEYEELEQSELYLDKETSQVEINLNEETNEFYEDDTEVVDVEENDIVEVDLDSEPIEIEPMSTQLTLPFNAAAEMEVARRINRIRIGYGLVPVAVTDGLTTSARIMVQETYGLPLSHTRPNGEPSFSIPRELLPSPWFANGANAATNPSAAGVVTAWMNSEGHRNNILRDNARFLGTGNSGSRWYQFFATGPAVTAIHIAPGNFQLNQGSDLEMLGINLNLNLADGGHAVIPIIDEMATGFNPQLLGSQTVTVRYLTHTATFQVEVLPRTYQVTVSNGTVVGGMTHAVGSTVSISPTIPADHRFVRWDGTSGLTFDRTVANTSFVMPVGNVTLTAIFERIPRTLTVVNGAGSGQVGQGSTASISATIPADHRFVRWDGASGLTFDRTAANTSFMMPANDVTLTAVFERIPRTLTVVDGTGSGQVGQGSTASISATIPADHRFVRWDGTPTLNFNRTVANTSFMMPASDVTLTATFERIPQTLIVNGGMGSGTFGQGSSVSISATIPANHQFVRWDGAPELNFNRTSANASFIMPSGRVEITAVFERIPRTLVINGGTGSGQVGQGSTATIIATAPTNYRFVRWDGTPILNFNRNDESTTFVMPASNVTLTAVFERIPRTLTITGGTGSGQVGQGLTASISATVPTDHRFVRWDGASELEFDRTSANASFTMPSEDVRLTAVFERIPRTLTVNYGTGSGEIGQGSTATITATVPVGYRFVRWDGTPTLSFNRTSRTTTFVMPAGDVTLTATFEEIPPTRIVTINNGLGSGEFAIGDRVGITATIPANHRFVGWDGTPELEFDRTVANASFAMPVENVVLTAVFERIPRTLTVTGGTGAGVVGQGLSRTITATVPANHRFVRWENVGGATMITNANRNNQSITFTMPASNVSVRAVFERIPRTLTVTGGTGGGTVGQGLSRTIRANAPQVGYRFDRWTTSTPGVSFANARNATTTIVMPARNATVRAVFVRRTAANPNVTMRRPGVIRSSVALRRGPGTAYHLNRNLRQGQEITVLNNGRNGWRFVQVGNSSVRGWIQSNQITETTTLGIVRAARVPLRAGANSGRTIMHLNRNATIIILGTNGNRSWTQVRVGRRTGWVRTSQIRAATPSARTRTQLQLRQGPGASFARLANNRVNRNARVIIIGRQGNWSHIRIGNRTGWVQTNQLR